MAHDYVFWDSDPGSKFCTLGGLLRVPDVFEIKRGVSRLDGFPPDAHFQMNKRFPKRVALPDSVLNLEDMAVVSPALRDLILEMKPSAVEILPVRILNHKGRDAGVPYAIVNPLTIVDVIDQGASELEWNSIDPTLIGTCDGLVLKGGGVPGEPLLFRPKFLETSVMLRRDLADAILAKKLTGLSFTEVAAFEC